MSEKQSGFFNALWESLANHLVDAGEKSLTDAVRRAKNARPVNHELWAINESLLQSYRAIAVSSESIFLAVGAILFDKDIRAFYGTALIGLLMIGMWCRVVRARHLVVDYYQHGCDSLDICTKDEYVHDRKLREKVNRLCGIKTNWGPTRRKMDIMIPFMVASAWVILMCSRAGSI